MPSENIQWFPGHMAKTRRLISENIKNVDVIIEILDARIPKSSRNPEIATLTAAKPTILLLNKATLADPEKTKEYLNELEYRMHKAVSEKDNFESRIRALIGSVKNG